MKHLTKLQKAEKRIALKNYNYLKSNLRDLEDTAKLIYTIECSDLTEEFFNRLIDEGYILEVMQICRHLPKEFYIEQLKKYLGRYKYAKYSENRTYDAIKIKQIMHHFLENNYRLPKRFYDFYAHELDEIYENSRTASMVSMKTFKLPLDISKKIGTFI